jgi:hypothetical protein
MLINVTITPSPVKVPNGYAILDAIHAQRMDAAQDAARRQREAYESNPAITKVRAHVRRLPYRASSQGAIFGV